MAIGDEKFLQALSASGFPTSGQRPGLVAFNVRRLVIELSAELGLDDCAARALISREAERRGGEVVEDEVLWLPMRAFN